MSAPLAYAAAALLGVLLGLLIGLWYSERDRRLFAEGGRRHRHTATKLAATGQSETVAADRMRELENAARESEIKQAIPELRKMARAAGANPSDKELRREAMRLFSHATGRGQA